jgi:hypothetical protein
MPLLANMFNSVYFNRGRDCEGVKKKGNEENIRTSLPFEHCLTSKDLLLVQLFEENTTKYMSRY